MEVVGGYMSHSRITKIDFPKFNGDDVRGWLFRCEQLFLLEIEKVNLVSIHLYDKALLWHTQFVKTQGQFVSWNVYKQAIIARFGSVYDDPMSELKNLKYETTARDYEDAFDNLLSRVDISEEHALSLFLGGLPTELAMSVRMFKPKTLADTYCLTNLQEATLNAVKKKSRSTFVPSNNRYGQSSNSSFHNSLLPTPNTNVSDKPNTPQAGNNRRLSKKEYAEKRANNLCLFCDQKYFHVHKCSGQLYFVVLVPDLENEGVSFFGDR